MDMVSNFYFSFDLKIQNLHGPAKMIARPKNRSVAIFWPRICHGQMKVPFSPPGFFNPYMVGIGSGNALLNNMPAKFNSGNKRYFFNIDVRQRSTTHMLKMGLEYSPS